MSLAVASLPEAEPRGSLRDIYASANGGDDEQGLNQTGSMRAPSYYMVRNRVSDVAMPVVTGRIEEHEKQFEMYWGGRDEIPYMQMPPSRISGKDGHVVWAPNECDDPDHPCKKRWV